jgi:hypothetical protein
LVVVGNLAFLGFDGFFAASVGLEAVGVGAAAACVGLAPPVDGEDVAAGVGAGADGAGVADVAVWVAAVVVVFFACWAGLCCLACLTLCSVLAFVAAVVGVLVAAAGCALVVDFVDPPLPQPAVTTATAATVQSRPRFIWPDSPLSVERFDPALQTRLRLQRFAAAARAKGRPRLLYTHRRPPRLRAFRGTIAGEESMADAHRTMR